MHCTENLKQIFPGMKLRGHVSQFLHSCIFERFMYSHDQSANALQQNRRNDFWEYINRSQKLGARVAQFHFGEYLCRFFSAVQRNVSVNIRVHSVQFRKK